MLGSRPLSSRMTWFIQISLILFQVLLEVLSEGILEVFFGHWVGLTVTILLTVWCTVWTMDEMSLKIWKTENAFFWVGFWLVLVFASPSAVCELGWSSAGTVGRGWGWTWSSWRSLPTVMNDAMIPCSWHQEAVPGSEWCFCSSSLSSPTIAKESELIYSTWGRGLVVSCWLAL